MVRDREAAADCVQDTFVTAATRLSSLRELDKLRPWLYAIARNEALRRIRERNRATFGRVARGHLGRIGSRGDGFPHRARNADRPGGRRALRSRPGGPGTDLPTWPRRPRLAEAPGERGGRPDHDAPTTGNHRAVARCAAGGSAGPNRAGMRGTGEFLSDWDGEFTILMRKRIARHIDTCPGCLEQRGKMVNPVALLGGAPLFIPAPAALRKQTLDRIQLVCAQTDMTGSASSGPSGSGGTTGGAGPGHCAGCAHSQTGPMTRWHSSTNPEPRAATMPTTPRSAGAACCCCSCGWARRGSPRLSWRCCGPSPGTARSTPSSSRKARTQPSPTLSSPPQTTPPRPPAAVGSPSTSAQLRPTVIPYVPPLRRSTSPPPVGPAVPASRQHQAGHAADPDVERKPLVCSSALGRSGRHDRLGRQRPQARVVRARRFRQLDRLGRNDRRVDGRHHGRVHGFYRFTAFRWQFHQLECALNRAFLPQAPLRPGGRKKLQKVS